MERPADARARRSLLPGAPDMRSLDTVDTCRMRLLSLRTRIETQWPAGGSFLRRSRGLAPESESAIVEMLVALPTPLPVRPGGDPETIFGHDDVELCAVAGRAVDAALNLLDGADLESTYSGQVSMLESHRPDAREPIVVTDPTVGLLVATIIGTLEAISEKITESAAAGAKPSQFAKAVAAPAPTAATMPHKRARDVPRI
jgi:hypothetical protein